MGACSRGLSQASFNPGIFNKKEIYQKIFLKIFFHRSVSQPPDRGPRLIPGRGLTKVENHWSFINTCGWSTVLNLSLQANFLADPPPLEYHVHCLTVRTLDLKADIPFCSLASIPWRHIITGNVSTLFPWRGRFEYRSLHRLPDISRFLPQSV
jgi:hypothetical protein